MSPLNSSSYAKVAPWCCPKPPGCPAALSEGQGQGKPPAPRRPLPTKTSGGGATRARRGRILAGQSPHNRSPPRAAPSGRTAHAPTSRSARTSRTPGTPWLAAAPRPRSLDTTQVASPHVADNLLRLPGARKPAESFRREPLHRKVLRRRIPPLQTRAERRLERPRFFADVWLRELLSKGRARV